MLEKFRDLRNDEIEVRIQSNSEKEVFYFFIRLLELIVRY